MTQSGEGKPRRTACPRQRQVAHWAKKRKAIFPQGKPQGWENGAAQIATNIHRTSLSKLQCLSVHFCKTQYVAETLRAARSWATANMPVERSMPTNFPFGPTLSAAGRPTSSFQCLHLAPVRPSVARQGLSSALPMGFVRSVLKRSNSAAHVVARCVLIFKGSEVERVWIISEPVTVEERGIITIVIPVSVVAC